MTKKKLKKLIISLTGGTLLMLGIIMIIIPGPAYLIIPAGLSILGTEYLWAEELNKKIKNKINQFFNKKRINSGTQSDR
ncbi:PGPGW domain-containing protein [Melioribacter sp. OK-6-Me]|uniref:PGPGW domain-containing protein n=1 Tax=unclassified Melioribacter TaxID=2627329 RepID=UPI003ED8B931